MSASDWPVEVDAVYSCWLWTGRRDRRDGRAIVWRGKSPIVAYRVVYEAEVGPSRPRTCDGRWSAWPPPGQYS